MRHRIPTWLSAGDEQLREDPRLGAGRREVREVPRALPVGQAGQQDVVEVAQHGRERLARLGRRLGQRGPDRTGLDAREHRELADALEVGGSPVERRRAVVAEAHPSSASAEAIRTRNGVAPTRSASSRASVSSPRASSSTSLLGSDLGQREQPCGDAGQEALGAPQLDRLGERLPRLVVATGGVVGEAEVADGVRHELPVAPSRASR